MAFCHFIQDYMFYTVIKTVNFCCSYIGDVVARLNKQKFTVLLDL